MKKFIMTALAASLTLSPLAVTAAEAAPQHRQTTTVKYKNNGRTVVTRRTVQRQPQARQAQYRNWRRGEKFDRRYAQNYREIDYRQYRGLRAPPRGYHYVRSGNDAVLVGLTSGVIAAVIANVIR
jgi:Ni/Co efflux regulator RcnB